MTDILYINEIFSSISGEINEFGQGAIATFVRFQGCNLSCDYCDTPKTQPGGSPDEAFTISEVIKEVRKQRNTHGSSLVIITGGEPLLQKEGLKELVKDLVHHGFRMVIETNGTYDLDDFFGSKMLDVIQFITWVVDYKIKLPCFPFSILSLRQWDCIKFIVEDFDEVDTFVQVMDKCRQKGIKAQFLLSPIEKKVSAKELVRYVLQKPYSHMFRINVQIHKYIGVA